MAVKKEWALGWESDRLDDVAKEIETLSNYYLPQKKVY